MLKNAPEQYFRDSDRDHIDFDEGAFHVSHESKNGECIPLASPRPIRTLGWARVVAGEHYLDICAAATIRPARAQPDGRSLR